MGVPFVRDTKLFKKSYVLKDDIYNEQIKEEYESVLKISETIKTKIKEERGIIST